MKQRRPDHSSPVYIGLSLLLMVCAASASWAAPCEEDFYWNAEFDGDGETEWFEVFTQTVDLTIASPSEVWMADRVRFQDDSPFGSVWGFELEIPAGASGFDADYHIEGVSREQSGAFLYWEDGGGALYNIQCEDVIDPQFYTPAELALVPYACGSAQTDWNWNGTDTPPAGAVKLHYRVFMAAVPGGDILDTFRLGLVGGECAAEVPATGPFGILAILLMLMSALSLLVVLVGRSNRRCQPESAA